MCGRVGRDPADLAHLPVSAPEGDPKTMWSHEQRDRKRPREAILGFLLSLVIVGLALALWRILL